MSCKTICSKGFEQISRNLDVLQNIFQLLEFPDQLALANVSAQLEHVFRNFICKTRYRKVKIKKYFESMKVTNELEEHIFVLTFEQFEYFRNIYASDIEDIKEYHGCALNPHHLQNLTSISYKYLMFTNDHLKLLAINCPKLEQLSIYGCCNKNRDVIKIGIDIEVGTLLKLKMLKSFSLRNSSSCELKHGIFEDLVSKLKLQYFQFKDLIVTESESEEVEDEAVTHIKKSNSNMKKSDTIAKSTMEELDIFISFRSTVTLQNSKCFINCFENLRSLQISIVDVVTDEIIATMATNCQKLQQLSFRSTNFEGIEKFAVFANLTDLSFYGCHGLTYDNLKEILTDMKLTAFKSVETKYAGVVFHYYFIAPTIKSIHIDALKSFEFTTASDYYKDKEKNMD